MCFHHMERKELQALCKKHKIPANLSNMEMANRLKEYFKEKEKSSIQGPARGLDEEIEGETESNNMAIDFHSMKRRELQALCQKHNVPANLPNLEMAKRLTEFFKEKEKSPCQGPKNVFDKIQRETDCTDMVMDFDNMKRKDLQALCQKHKIPANLSNLEMAKRLTKFFKENEKLSIQGLINEQNENAAMTREVKKVRFSPEHELFEFTRSPKLKQSGQNSVSVRPSNLPVETVDNGLTNSENVDRQGRVTRSRGLKLTEGHGNGTNKGKKGVKFHEQKKDVATIENTDNGGVTDRVLRSKGKELADDNAKNATKRGKAEIEDKNVLDDVDYEKSTEEIVTKTKRVKWAVEIVDNVPIVSGEADDNRVVTRRSSMKKGVLEKNGQLRRSKRNAKAVGDSKVLNDDTRKRENARVKGSRKSAKMLAEDDAKGETGGGVTQIEEPVKLEMRSDRRESVIALPEKEQNGELIAETENMRSSSPHLVIAGGTSKIGKVPQPITRRSRRINTILEPVASEEKIDTDVAFENCETENLLSPRRSSRVASFCKSLENKDELGGDTITRRSRHKTTVLEPVVSEKKLDTYVTVGNYETKKILSPRRSSRVASFCKSLENNDELGVNTIIKQKNEPRKRKRGPILEGDVKTDDVWSSSKQSMRESRNKKSVSIPEPQLSGSERAESIGGTDTRNKNATNDVGLGQSNRKTSREEQDVAIAESAETNFIDRNELVNSVENATSIIAELETDLAESEKQISARNIKDARKVDSFEFGGTETTNENVTSDVGLGESRRKTSREEQVVAIAESAETNIIDRNELVNSVENATSTIAELETDLAESEKQNSARNIKDSRMVDPFEFGGTETRNENVTSDVGLGESNRKTSREEQDVAIAGSAETNIIDRNELVNSVENATSIIDVGLGESSRKTSREEQDVAIAESAETNIIDRNELVNSVENATSIIAELEMDLAESKKQISASNIKDARQVDLFEFDVQDIVEQDTTNMDKNQSEAQLFSPIKDDSSHDDTIDNQILKEHSNVSGNEGFAESSAAAESVLPADLVDRGGEIEGVFVQENLYSIEIGEANAVSSAIACHHNVLDYIEASNGISLDNNEDTVEVCAPGSCADPEVTEAEADMDTQPCSDVADHAGEVEAFSVQNVDHLEASNSNLDTNKGDGASEAGEIGTPELRESCIVYTDSKSALQLKETPPGKLRSIEGNNVEIEKGGCLKEHKFARDEDDEFGVADLFAGESSVGVSSQDRGIVSAYPEVTEAEADKDTQPCSDVADHAGEIEAISVQNVDHLEASNSNLDTNKGDGASEAGEIGTNNNLDTNKGDGASEAGEIGTPELRESCIVYTDSKSALQLKETPSGKLRSIEGDNVEIEKGGCLKEHKIASDEDDEFGVAGLFAGERSVRVSSQDRGIVSGVYLSMESAEQLMDKECLALSPKTMSPNMANICPETDLEAERTGKGEECCTDKSSHPEVAKTDGDESPGCHENQEFIMSNILDLERRDEIVQQDGETLSGENSVEGFDEGMEIKLKSGCEAYQISEGDGAKNNDNHENRNDEDWRLSMSNLFDGEKSDSVTSQVRGFFPVEESNKGFCEQVVFDVTPVVSTMCGEVEIGAVSSSLKEISPSKPRSSSKSPGTGPVISGVHEIIGNESSGDTIPEKEVAVVQNNMSDGDHEIFDQADEHANVYTSIQEEQPKSPLAINNAISNTLGASESKITGLAHTWGKETFSTLVEGSNANEDGNDGNCGEDEDKLADACISDVDMSMDCTVRKSRAERIRELEFHHPEDTVYHQSSNVHEKYTLTDVIKQPTDLEPSQSLTATVNDVNLTGPNDTMKNSNVNSGNNVINKKAQEMEGERGDKSAKTTDVNDFLPTDKVPDSGPSVDREDYQLRLLFATPIKIDSPSKVNKTSSHENESNSADKLLTKSAGIAENLVAQIISDEKMRDVENELENCLCPSSDSGEKTNFEESNEGGSVELMKTSSLGLSEASDKHLTESTCDEEGLKKCDLLTEENKKEGIISLGESCHFKEAANNECGLTVENTISSFGSSGNLDKVECCQDILMDTDLPENLSCGNNVCPKSEKKMALSSAAECEIFDADIHLTSCFDSNNVSDALIDTLEGPMAPMDAEGADIGTSNSEKDVAGTSPSSFPNGDDGVVTEREDGTGDDIDPYEAKKWDEKDGDSRPLPVISDEPHCNSEVAILKSPSAGNTLELQSMYKDTIPIAQNEDNVLSAAEQGFSVCGAEFYDFSNLAMHILPGDTENGVNEKSEKGTPVYNLEGDHEKESEGVEKNPTATNVQFSISELHLEQNVLDSNNDVHSVSGEVTVNENCFDVELDVGTPLLNLEGDDEKYDKMVEENSTAGVVQFPFSELHLEEKTLGNQFLKETEVADTIKEYIDSELAFMNEVVTVCEDGMESEKLEEPISFNLHVGGYTADKSSVETACERKIEEMPFKESVTGNSGPAGNDAILLEKEDLKTGEGGPISSSRQLCSSVMENARTILIHGTPSKVDMKENGPAYKSSNMGDVTAARPAKRKALQDVKWE